jgi:hypothetical protein
MTRSKRLLSIVSLLLDTFLLGSLSLWAAEGIITRVPDVSGKLCHLKFPAIREDTLFGNNPILKDPSEGDLIDFHGPCDHDPLGQAEILRQRGDARRERDTRMNSD